MKTGNRKTLSLSMQTIRNLDSDRSRNKRVACDTLGCDTYGCGPGQTNVTDC